MSARDNRQKPASGVTDRVTGRVESAVPQPPSNSRNPASKERERLSSSHPSRLHRRRPTAPAPSRVSAKQLEQMAAELVPLDRELVESVGRLRLVTGGQLRRLHFADSERPAAAARRARRRTASLSERAALFPLSRRIGGARAGSDGQVFALGLIGRRLLRLWKGDGATPLRSTWEPSTGFVEHGVLVSEMVVQAIEAQRQRPGGEPVTFAVERDCWRSFVGADGETLTLKPDAELRIPDGEYEDCWLLEIDRATEHRSTIRRKLGLYRRYWQSGVEQETRGVFPLVAWITVTPERAAVLRDLVAELPEVERELFRVETTTDAARLLVGESH